DVRQPILRRGNHNPGLLGTSNQVIMSSRTGYRIQIFHSPRVCAFYRLLFPQSKIGTIKITR
ncbi:MAG TPA: hypothetical protein VK553_01950, partial [Candidatus Nitrosopolaris rasttigaisensis]|nr:hypothetical protein [Candidatus Nitrosopolaris rasttigaisensis]